MFSSVMSLPTGSAVLRPIQELSCRLSALQNDDVLFIYVMLCYVMLCTTATDYILYQARLVLYILGADNPTDTVHVL